MKLDSTSKCGRYGDFIHELDWIVGEVLTTLEEEGIADNTIVIFTSDNGGMLNLGGQNAWKLGHRMNSDFLGFKFDAWEGGHRIPFIIKWPGKVEPSTVSDKLISNVDLLATLASIVDQPLSEKDARDSYNILPVLTGDNDKQIRNHLIISPRHDSHMSIRKGKWMYIGARGNGGWNGGKLGQHILGGPIAHKFTKQVNSDIEKGKIKKDASPAQLYDLQAVPYQKNNVYKYYPDIAKEMKEELIELMNSDRTAK